MPYWWEVIGFCRCVNFPLPAKWVANLERREASPQSSILLSLPSFPAKQGKFTSTEVSVGLERGGDPNCELSEGVGGRNLWFHSPVTMCCRHSLNVTNCKHSSAITTRWCSYQSPSLGCIFKHRFCGTNFWFVGQFCVFVVIPCLDRVFGLQILDMLLVLLCCHSTRPCACVHQPSPAVWHHTLFATTCLEDFVPMYGHILGPPVVVSLPPFGSACDQVKETTEVRAFGVGRSPILSQDIIVG